MGAARCEDGIGMPDGETDANRFDSGDPGDDGGEGESRGAGAVSRLNGQELLALQLAARGYTLEQIARLLDEADVDGVVALLRRAAEALGAADAIAEARARGLIV
jgi:hypothetical protein